MRNGLVVVALIATALLALSSCAPGVNEFRGTPPAVSEDGKVPGFWLGLWHGIIAPISFIVSLFNKAVNVYEVHNSGNWYNFGFIIGLSLSMGGGGGGAAMAKKRRRRDA